MSSRLPSSTAPSRCCAGLSLAFVPGLVSSCLIHYWTTPQASLLPGDVDMEAAKKDHVTKRPEGDETLLPGALPTQLSGFVPTDKGQLLVPHTAVGDPLGPKIPKKFRGAPVHNTVATRERQDPDRHCYRAARGGKIMKCEVCYDYNKGVAARCCQVCGRTNSVFTGP